MGVYVPVCSCLHGCARAWVHMFVAVCVCKCACTHICVCVRVCWHGRTCLCVYVPGQFATFVLLISAVEAPCPHWNVSSTSTLAAFSKSPLSQHHYLELRSHDLIISKGVTTHWLLCSLLLSAFPGFQQCEDQNRVIFEEMNEWVLPWIITRLGWWYAIEEYWRSILSLIRWDGGRHFGTHL